MGLILFTMYPVLPACICYQVAYRIITDNKPSMDKGRIAAFIFSCAILFGLIAGYFHLTLFG